MNIDDIKISLQEVKNVVYTDRYNPIPGFKKYYTFAPTFECPLLSYSGEDEKIHRAVAQLNASIVNETVHNASEETFKLVEKEVGKLYLYDYKF